MFAGNCSSLSEKMIEYIVSKHNTFDMWSLVETYNRGKHDSPWKQIGYKIHNNNAKLTSEHGTHGGEFFFCQ